MRTNDVLGIIFPNAYDELLTPLTSVRSMGSMPVAGRYRLIDFTLSNLVNAGISKVGLVTRLKYKSLMDHLGSGKAWDLDRKTGGLYLLPPYAFGDGAMTHGHVDALFTSITFLKNSIEKYVVLCNSNLISNFDVRDMIEKHILSGADMTVAYKTCTIAESKRNLVDMSFDEGGRVNKVVMTAGSADEKNYGLDILIIEREKLIDMVTELNAHNKVSMSRNIIQDNVDKMNIMGYKVDNYAAIIDSPETYVRVHNELLESRDVRLQVFNRERPVFTKTRDDMPTRYGLDSHVTGSIIADGCLIEGIVKNSVIFRGVKIGKGAVVENCIIMQDTVVGDNSKLKYITIDKDVVLSEGTDLVGLPTYYLYVPKAKEV